MRKVLIGLLAFILTLGVLACIWWPVGYYGFLNSCLQVHKMLVDTRPAFCRHPLTAIAGWVWLLALPVLLIWLPRRFYRWMLRTPPSDPTN